MALFARARGLKSDDPARWAVVGLGNPGERYAATRHNAGALVVEALSRRHSSSFKRHKSGCLVAELRIAGQHTVLARPTSFMNESGRPVRELVHWFKAPLDRLVVVHDELDVSFGEVRIKVGGGTAGHQGLNSLASYMSSTDFVRVRVGISRPRTQQDPADYVLSQFSTEERKELGFVVDEAADAVERIIEVGVERAMNEVNTRRI